MTLQAYPNPAGDFIEIKGLPVVNCGYSVFNLHGQFMQGGTLNAEYDTILLHKLPEGAYFLQLNGLSLKVVIQR